MKSTYVKDFVKNQVIDSETFAVFESEKMEDKNGKPYYKLVLGDKTGRVQSKIWNDKLSSVDIKCLEVGKIISVSAKIEEYKGNLQMNILKAEGVDENALDDFLESSEYNADDMINELMQEVNQIQDEGIKKVLTKILTDPEVLSKFKYSVAASSIHHDFRSGLLQHVLEMITISKSMRRFYPQLNYDVLTAGIILHDIGKIEELGTNGVSTVYTKKGGLIGHIVLGVMMFERFGGKDLPEDTFLHICHLILSHHGSIDMGSPVLPSTTEALMLTHIDNLSAKTRSALSQINLIPEGSEFSKPYMFLNNTRFWSGAKPKTNDTKSENSNTSESNDSTPPEDFDVQQLFL